ncbi:hypothetical protein [Prauserella muralis]|uniref:Uncharacterized protein n=1 Tax=Prauserella muralis TaxID=588067 RepID=A0A2V4AL61_9PSEU|nr:hypothetical protein [Prauserella muralis]PXY21041.1 hypothetical protein BAY60_26570 [Prauserella muralis]TWE30116.1 hypothetical protein FHX69_2813 [Prauserella muralis]
MPTTTSTTARGPRRTLWLLRATVALTTVCVLAQPVLAGGYLTGRFDFLDYHSATATLIEVLALLQVVASLLYWRPGGGALAPLPLSGVLLLAVTLQIGMGYSRQLAVHIPLGVLVALLQSLLCVWVYRRAARQSTRRRRRRTHEPVA